MDENGKMYESFRKEYLEYRVIQNVDFPEENIRSGDLLIMRRFQGLSTMYMIASGSAISNTAMALWDNGELFVVVNVNGIHLSAVSGI